MAPYLSALEKLDQTPSTRKQYQNNSEIFVQPLQIAWIGRWKGIAVGATGED
jgi:hypothetical protein